ncbi:hypothetical protein SAMN06295967_11094 [Belliella buryatensis]|uniref:Uncharacterized protein n=1 Tax=Belliella buryatensis TaxID=1500549 RepID=A0A239ESQ9_9BACT|nr:hypothetical protein SAMN06295967_11094 [Belliella buryatensis]
MAIGQQMIKSINQSRNVIIFNFFRSTHKIASKLKMGVLMYNFIILTSVDVLFRTIIFTVSDNFR